MGAAVTAVVAGVASVEAPVAVSKGETTMPVF